MSTSTYPVHVEARLDTGLNRWLWLVKWVLAIPHVLVLALLWTAFVVLSIVAFFAILVTGRYPRGIFDFNVGVLRWTWRVGYYAYGALATDRYPPFSLREDPSYPAHLEVDYPQRLSRGLVLVKWWLLALPHYLVVGLFLGGGTWVVQEAVGSDWQLQWGGGLVGVLVLVAAVVLLFTGRYPGPVFDLVLGMHRWALRVAAYAALMTDDYPPFRLDQGGREPSSGALSVPSAPPSSPPPAGRPWTGGRIAMVVIGSLVLLGSLGVAAGGLGTLLVDRVVRDDAGFVMSEEVTFSTTSYAVASENLEVHVEPAGTLPDWLVGDARITVDPVGDQAVFVGVAKTSDATDYLAGVAHATVVQLPPGARVPGWVPDWRPVYRDVPGGSPAGPPAEEDIWVARSSGSGEQSVTWPLESGDWTVVLMAADASPGVTADLAAGATLPALGWVALVLLATAGVGLLLALVLLVLALRPETGATPTAAPPPAGPLPPPPVPERSLP